MAYNTKMIKTDVDKKPIPQFYNPVNDEYEVLQGANGAARHIIYGADGQPVSTTGNKLAVRATEIETIIGEVQAAPTANTLLARLKNLETKVDAIIADGIKLSGSKVAVKRHTLSNVIPFNNYLFVGENTRKYCITGFLAWHCEYPKKMVIIKNTSEFAIKWGWCLYDHLDVATNQLEDTGIIASSSSLVDLAAGATVEIPFDTLKYPAVGASVYLLHTAGGIEAKGSATIQFLGGV